jgi:hypothetical protein
MAEAGDGSLLVAGEINIGPGAQTSVLKATPSGDLAFARTYGEGRLYGVHRNSGAILAGETASFGGSSEILLTRLPRSGALAFSASSGAEQKNVSGVKKPLPGTPSTLTPTITAPRRPLAP